jgi:N-formylglutamate deformylase
LTESGDTFALRPGSTPLLLSMPHTGTELPEGLLERLVPRAAGLEDTDWHIERLYAFARELGAGTIVPRYSRYAIDLNRPREDSPMYPGVNNTGLVPLRFFSGDALYRHGQEPAADEIAARVERYWLPYHGALAGELERLRDEHGYALLFDAHSIKSELPWLFEGTLPGLNLGTAGGASCAPSLGAALAAVLAGQRTFSHAVNGRFKGGHITRRHGQPAERVHAVQLEMSWRCYLDEARPSEWNAERAAQVEPLLRKLLQCMIDWKP